MAGMHDCNKVLSLAWSCAKVFLGKENQVKLDETFRFFQFVTLLIMVAEIWIEYFQFKILLGLELFPHTKSVELPSSLSSQRLIWMKAMSSIFPVYICFRNTGIQIHNFHIIIIIINHYHHHHLHFVLLFCLCLHWC